MQDSYTHLRIVGIHAQLASAEDIASAIKRAAEVFAEHHADPRACAAAKARLESNELLTREEALLYVVWEEADDAAMREITRGWLSRDVDIRLDLAVAEPERVA